MWWIFILPFIYAVNIWFLELACLSNTYTLHMQAANIEAEASGIHDGEYQLTKHEFSGLGRGKYSGMYYMYTSNAFISLYSVTYMH